MLSKVMVSCCVSPLKSWRDTELDSSSLDMGCAVWADLRRCEERNPLNKLECRSPYSVKDNTLMRKKSDRVGCRKSWHQSKCDKGQTTGAQHHWNSFQFMPTAPHRDEPGADNRVLEDLLQQVWSVAAPNHILRDYMILLVPDTAVTLELISGSAFEMFLVIKSLPVSTTCLEFEATSKWLKLSTCSWYSQTFDTSMGGGSIYRLYYVQLHCDRWRYASFQLVTSGLTNSLLAVWLPAKLPGCVFGF